MLVPKADVQVSLDRDAVLPGETVEATIRILGGRRDLKIQEGRLELLYENEYWYRHEVGSGSTRRTKASKATDRADVETVRFLEAGHVAADTPYEATASLTVPPDAVPSAEGEITKVRWRVVATLARPHAMDVHRRTPLTVLSRRRVPPSTRPTWRPATTWSSRSGSTESTSALATSSTERSSRRRSRRAA